MGAPKLGEMLKENTGQKGWGTKFLWMKLEVDQRRMVAQNTADWVVDVLGRRLEEKTETCDTHSTLWYGEQTSRMLLCSEPMHDKRKEPTDIACNLDMVLILGLLLSIANKLPLVGGTSIQIYEGLFYSVH